MKPWTRDDTKEWIAQLENRIEDIEFYIKRAIEWCEENEVLNDKLIFTCCIMTIIWVCYCREEPISTHELFEILGVKDWQEADDLVVEFNPTYGNMELEEILGHVVSSFY